MRALDLELTFLTAIAAPVLLGIGIDDGIHMIERLARDEPLATALREAGSSMTMTTVTSVGALCAFALATFPGIREIGLVVGVGLIVCLLASLHMILSAWRLAHGRCPGES